jgi:hypothetical protein
VPGHGTVESGGLCTNGLGCPSVVPNAVLEGCPPIFGINSVQLAWIRLARTDQIPTDELDLISLRPSNTCLRGTQPVVLLISLLGTRPPAF